MNKILLFLLELVTSLTNCCHCCFWLAFSNFEVKARLSQSSRRLRPLKSFCIGTLRTNILKRFLVNRFWVRQLRINSCQYKLHLKIVGKILKALDFTLESFYEIFHIATIQTCLPLLFRSMWSDNLDNLGNLVLRLHLFIFYLACRLGTCSTSDCASLNNSWSQDLLILNNGWRAKHWLSITETSPGKGF